MDDYTEINRLAAKAIKLRLERNHVRLCWMNVSRRLYQILKEQDNEILVTDQYSIMRDDIHESVSVRLAHANKNK